MKVFGTGVSTDPKRAGLFFRGGDVCTPRNGRMLQGPPWPTKVWRFYCKLPVLPFLCVRLGRFGFYAGFKVYGVDAPEYKNWLPASDVYAGSLAMVLTFRAFTDG